MKRWRGGAAASSIAVALILPAAPAWANEAPTVVITSPGDGAVLTSVTVSGTAKMPNPLNSVTDVSVSVRSKLGRGAPVSCNDNATCGAAPGKETAFSFSPSLGANGPYEATVTARGKELIELDGLQPGAATRSFKIEAKPAAPQDVKAQANPDRSVTVTWGRNREVDLIGYQVQRRSGGSGFTVVDSVGQPPDGATVSLNDKGPAATGGTFEYVVLAVRPDGDGNTKTPVSTTSAPSGAVSVAGPDGASPPGPSGGAKPSKGAAVPASLQVSSFLAKAGGSGPPMVAPPAVSPPDGGFDPTLPLAVPDGELTAEGVEGDDEIALDEDPASSDRRNVLIPIAAGLLLCVTAAHLRWLNRRITEPSTDSELPVWSEDDAEDEAAALAFASATPPVQYAQIEVDEAPPVADARRSRRRRRSDRDRVSIDTEEAWEDEALLVPAPGAASRPPYDVEAAAFDEAPSEVLVAPPVSADSGRRSRRLRGARGDTGAVAETTGGAPAGDAVAAEPADEAPLPPPPAAERDEARRSRRARREVAPSPATEAALQALAARAGGPAIEADVEAAAEADARAHAATERRAAKAAAEEIAARAADKAAAEAAIADAIAAEAAARQAGAEAAAREAAAREAIAESVVAEARAREAIAEAVVAEASAAEAAETERAMTAATEAAVSAATEAAVSAATEAAVSAATEAAVSAATEAAVEAAVAAATMAATEAAVAAATNAATAAATEAAVAAATTAATDTATEAAVAAATTAATTAATEAAIAAATEIAVAAATEAATAAATEAATAAATEAATAAATETAVAAATQAAVGAATEAATAAAIAAITAAADFDNRLAVQTGPDEYVDPSTGEPTAAPWTAPAGAPEPSGAWTDAPGDSLHWAPLEAEPVGPFSRGTAWAADSAEGDPDIESSTGTGEPYWAPSQGDPEPGVSTGSSDPVWAEEADAGDDPAAGTGTPWVTAHDEVPGSATEPTWGAGPEEGDDSSLEEATATGTTDDFDADDADELDVDYELEADGELDADAHAESEAEPDELDADADEGAASAGEATPEWEPDEWPRPAGATPLVASTDEEPDDEAWDSVVLVSGQPQVERE